VTHTYTLLENTDRPPLNKLEKKLSTLDTLVSKPIIQREHRLFMPSTMQYAFSLVPIYSTKRYADEGKLGRVDQIAQQASSTAAAEKRLIGWIEDVCTLYF
jgi:hypothetical protein